MLAAHKRFPVSLVILIKEDTARFDRDKAEDSFQQRGLASPVVAENTDDFPSLCRQGNPVQNLVGSVSDMKALHSKEQCQPVPNSL